MIIVDVHPSRSFQHDYGQWKCLDLGEHEDFEKTALTTTFDLFGPPCMPFGLRSATQKFQRFIDSVTHELDSILI